MRHPFRRKNLSPRLLPFYAVAAIGLLAAEPTRLGFAVGGLLVAAGTALRSWGAGHLVKTDRLVVTGPYAHMRHPLYAGMLLLGLGFGIIAGRWGMILVVGFLLPVFFLYYLPYKERVESARLERRHGSAYARYRAAVPAVLPTRAAWTAPGAPPREADRHWSLERFRDNDEFGTLVGIFFALGLLALRPALPL